MKVLVTGAAGFIGSNIVQGLNQQGITDVVAVDNLSKAEKFLNLVDLEIADYRDKSDFLARLLGNHDDALNGVDVVFHEGACSDTMEHNGQYMMQNNFQYTLALFEACQRRKIPFLYASSAAVYGAGPVFEETRTAEQPLNVYGYSKFLFDQVLRRKMHEGLTAPVYGFRYFNVYGLREQHKGRMASVAYHNTQQMLQEGHVRLFGPYDGYVAGGHQRDFVSVEDVVAVNLHFMYNAGKAPNGVYNLGTGRAQSFNDVALAVVNTARQAQHASTEPLAPLNLEQAVELGLIRYIDFPEALKGKYQSYTQANLERLRAAGYAAPFMDVETGVGRYVAALLARYGKTV